MNVDSRSFLPPDAMEALRAQGLPTEPFQELATRLRAGGAPDQGNRLQGKVEPPTAEDVETLPPHDSRAYRELIDLGNHAIERGEVGVLVLAGGMATRFGGCVKALVPVLGERHFLDLKLADVLRMRARLGAPVPFDCMTSFATDAAVAHALQGVPDTATFEQFWGVRLGEDGSVFREENGGFSRYAAGHGDLAQALRLRGVMRRFRERGGRIWLMSNVDNLTATLDPAMIGAHLRSGRALTVEVAAKVRGDRGGAPARVDGRLEIVESFRFPADFDQDRIDVFNTNTVMVDAASIDRDFDLRWFAVQKRVEGRTAFQLERLVGELTSHLASHFVRVERDGPHARFQPIKEIEELEPQALRVAAALRARGVID